MNNSALYVLTVLIWGSTWLAITYQLGDVSPLVSIAHRFALAGALVFAWLVLRRQRVRMALRDHAFVLLQGLCLFCINYVFIYTATQQLASGLVAVVFSSMVILNMLGGAVFLGARMNAGVAVGGIIGMVGMAGVFLPELEALDLSDANFRALLLCLAGTCFASCGNLVAARHHKRQLPVLTSNAWGMVYGSLVLYAAAFAMGHEIRLVLTPEYIGSLLYLSVFGSVIAFWAYLTLIGQIGADRASYSNLLFPIVALMLSTLIEGYQWTLPSFLGLCLVLFGNWLVMRSPRS
ncbi:MAG: EamA family transporter [Halieaceae bacterium]|nr:EamA family transporter [Halieaceae bacterium]